MQCRHQTDIVQHSTRRLEKLYPSFVLGIASVTSPQATKISSQSWNCHQYHVRPRPHLDEAETGVYHRPSGFSVSFRCRHVNKTANNKTSAPEVDIALTVDGAAKCEQVRDPVPKGQSSTMSSLTRFPRLGTIFGVLCPYL